MTDSWSDGWTLEQLRQLPWHPVKISEVELHTRPQAVRPEPLEQEASSSSRSTLKLAEHLEPSAPPGLERPTLLQQRMTKRTRRMAITNYIRTQAGARAVLEELDTAQSAYVSELLTAVLPELPLLACDPYGIQVLSKLLACHEDTRCKLAHRLSGSMLKLTKDKHGCWFVQQVLQYVPSELQEIIQAELRGRILLCSQHLHGNFVLQKCVELLPGSIGFILRELKNHVLEAAMHVYSCRVLQRLIEHCKHDRADMSSFLEVLLRFDHLQRLILDPYGNNVVRAVLQCGASMQIQKIVRVFLAGELLTFARNRHGSLVLERCLEALKRRPELRNERDALMSAILDGQTPLFSQICLDRFGNYIAQRSIDVCEDGEQQRIQQLLMSLGPKLRRAVNGRHILQAARKRFGSTLSVTGEDS